MSDEGFVLLILVVVGSVVAGAVKALGKGMADAHAQYAEAKAHEQSVAEEIRVKTERRALQLIVEFPELSDHDITMLMRDELMNMRAEQRWYGWATQETVGRMRRTLLVEIARQQRAENKSIAE